MRSTLSFPAVATGYGLPSFFWLLMLLLLSGAGFGQSVHQSLQQSPEHARTGEFFLIDAGGHTQSALHQQTDVTMHITGMTARVNVRQTFTNATGEWQEGTYVFPLPEDSAVNAMRMLAGDREIIGEVRERAEAKRVYDQARSEGRKAALVEQQRPNLFTQKVANLAPGETISIDLQYVQALRYTDARFRLRFPMTLGQQDSAGDTLSMTIRLDAGVPLTRVGSTTHDMGVTAVAGYPGRYELELRAGRTRMDRDFELEWAPEAAAAPQAAVFVDTRAEGTFMQLMLLPPHVEEEIAPLGREVIIVLDSSGSMDGASIVQAKQSVHLALSGLRAGDWFNLVDFDDSFRTLFEVSQPASAANIQRARIFVNGVQAGGGTEMLPALQYALTLAPAVADGQDLLQQIVFVTDGAVGNEDELFRVIAAELDDARLFTVGIGSAPNSYFMRKAAEAGRGTYTYVSDTTRVTENISALMRKLENAVMDDLSVAWPAGVDAEYYPEHIPDLYLGEPLFVTARLNGKVPAVQDILVSGSLAGEPWQQQLTVNVADGDSTAGLPVNTSSLASYWAQQKIDALLNESFSGNRDDAAFKEALRKQVLDVALPFQLLSPYTSFIAVEQRIRGPQVMSSAATNDQTRTAQLAQQVQYPATATPAAAWLLAGSLALLCAALALFSLRREKEIAHA
jgi:Ca-activated chloride channel family protein